jgi:AraC-like DNA-binding protein
MALARLTKTRQPISQVAADLGYADTSAFYRAFTGWTGMSPEQFRHRLAGNDGLPAASAGPDRRPAPTPRVTAGRQRSREFGPTEA